MSSPDAFHAARVVHAGTFRLPGPPGRAFVNFSPDGERAWVPDWNPEYLYPRDGTLEPGLVFRTSAGGERTLWMVLRFDPDGCTAQYMRIVPESRLGLVTVSCTDAGADETEVRVRYELTGLNDDGNRALAQFTAAAFAAMLEDWCRRISELLAQDTV